MAKRKKTAQKTRLRAKSKKPAKKADRKRDGVTVIKVIGVGGGGGNAVTRMMESDRLRGVEFIAVNTDAQDLDYASAHHKLYIGRALTHGLGAGMNPEIGKQAAEENRSEIGEMLEGADIVFVTAGFGGGTGTGASPVIAEIAREKGILTIAVVTKPFAFEGTQRMNIAQEGLNRLKDKVDAIVVIPNDRIFSLIDKDTPLVRAFAYIDEVLRSAVKGIAELINSPGIINVDFADIKTIIRDAGTTLIGIGTASGQDRSIKAVNAAINSPLLEISIDGAKGVLFGIAGGRDLKMAEINEIAKAISAPLDSNAKVIFGAYYDRSLKDKNIKVTVIATGFNGVFGRTIAMPSLFIADDIKRRDVFGDEFKKETKKKEDLGEETKPQKVVSEEKDEEGLKKTESWEIPTFLRKRKK